MVASFRDQDSGPRTAGPSRQSYDQIPTQFFEQVYPYPVLVLQVPLDSVRFDSSSAWAADKHDGVQVQPSSSNDAQTNGCRAPPNEAASPEAPFVLSEDTLRWTNRHWQSLSGEQRLSSFLDQESLERLSSWVIDGTKSTPFTLQCGSPRVSLSLAKSYMEDPGKAVYIVITSQTVAIDDSSSDSTRSSDTAIGLEREEEEAFLASPTRPPELSPPPESSSSAPLSPGDGAYESDAQLSSILAGHDVKHDISALPSKSDPKAHEHITGQYKISIAAEEQSAKTLCRDMFNAMDWTGKPCGPPSTWAPAVRALVDIAFDTVTADAVYIGTEPSNLVSIYNQNYARFLDHPNTFGKLMSEVWKDVWFFFEPMMREVLKGKPMYQDFALLPYLLDDRGVWLEKYHSYSCHPIYDGSKVVGVYVASMDWTTDVLTRRHSEVIRALAVSIGVVRTRADLFLAAAEVLSTAATEIPFFIGYSVLPMDAAANKDPTADTVKLSLESTIGVPSSHRSAPSTMLLDVPKMARSPRSSSNVAGLADEDLGDDESVSGQTSHRTDESIASGISFASSRSSDKWPTVEMEGDAWPIRLALMTRRCIRVENIRHLIADYPIRQWDELPDAALVIPLSSDASVDVPPAVIIVGLNYHCAVDDHAYMSFLQNLRAHLTSALGAVIALEQEIARSEEKEKMERAKTAWFRGAAHEFRSPLSLIAGPLEELSSNTADLSPRHKEIVLLANRNVARLQRIVSSLLDFSRMEAGRFQARFTPTDLGSFVTDLCSLFKPAMKQPHIEFTVDVEERSEPVPVDRVLMETALANLLSNAIKYTKHGSITVRLWYDDNNANISVVDTGIGIAADELDMVTRWFHRSQAALASGIEGTGLGLGLAREIISLHNGELLVESNTATASHSSGSTFTARLPLEQAVVQEDVTPVAFGTYGREMVRDVIGWERDQSGSVGSQESSPSYGEGLQFQSSDLLLVVDDNKDIREYIKLIFQPFCRVVEAEDGVDALRVMAQETPHLVLTDMMMPRMSGMDMLMEIRKTKSWSHVPVILLSAAQDEESRVQALLYGADDFLSKPFKPRELLARAHLQMEMGKSRLDLETKFHERELELQVLSDACPSGIIRADHSGRVLYANLAFREPAGLAADSTLEDWQDHLDPSSAENFKLAWNDFIFGKRSETAIRWKWQTGRSMLGFFIRLDKASGVSGIIGCITDVTYEEEKIEEAERRRAEAEESRRQQELIVDLTSHEIRTPVSAILQCASLVEENLRARRNILLNSPNGLQPEPSILWEIDEDIKALESIYHCGVTQERIASDILSLARLQLGMLSVHHIPVDIKHEAEKVLRVFHSECKMSQIDLQLQFGPGFDAFGHVLIATDPVRFGQVVTNLVNNAVRFVSVAPERRIVVRYDISREGPMEGCTVPRPDAAPEQYMGGHLALGTDVWIYASVSDTGPGMTEVEQSGIFERFKQGSKMIHTKYGGTGLGLFICKKIVGLLGGDIDTISAPGKGTTLRFYIKSVVVPPEQSPGPPPTRQLSAEEPAASPPRSVRPVLRRGSTQPTLPPVCENSVAPLESPDLPLVTTERTISTERASVTSTERGSISSTERSSISSSDRRSSVSTEWTTISSVSSAMSTMSVTDSMSYSILVVEDNLVSQRVLQRQLMKLGNTVQVASNGQEALDVLAEHKGTFDVLVMDLEMPIMGGLEAAGTIRRLEAEGELPPQRIIALTGNAREEKVQQALESGINNVMIKPYRLPKLVDMIQATIDSTPGPNSQLTHAGH